MSREWNSAVDLARAMAARARAGKNVVLSPETALAIVDHIAGPAIARGPGEPFLIDSHKDGSAVYRLDRRGEIVEVVAFGRTVLAARAAFDFLCEAYPDESFSQRRRGWVEMDRIVGKKGESGMRISPSSAHKAR